MNRAVYTYETCCINSTAQAINDMTDRARGITYATFMRNVGGWEKVKDIDPFSYYESPSSRNGGLKLKNDWAVSYCRSVYRGKSCVYACHSAIEYIFVKH